MNYLTYLPATAETDSILKASGSRQRWVNQEKKGFLRYREPMQVLTEFQAKTVDCTGDTVKIGDPDELAADDRELVRKALTSFMPWRKGPFNVFGIDIDAEWRSEKKWQRLLPKLPDLTDKVVADIGCNNGYYMFRMTPYQPRMVLGLEPSVQHYYCFKGLNSMAGYTNLHIDLLGVEHMPLFAKSFDVIFLMGVIYHRVSPMDVLRDILSALKPGGTLIVESQAIPGDEPYALFPEKTYAKAPGTYFVPTGKCLLNWMKRAGFQECDLFAAHPMTALDQRRTAWMEFESYSSYLDPEDPSLTVEGYPAPWRVYLTGTRG